MIKILGLTTQFGGAGIIEFSNIGTSWGGGGDGSDKLVNSLSI